MIGSSIPHIADELRRAGIGVTSLDWATGRHGTFVHRAVANSEDDMEDLLRWAACRGVTLGDVSVRESARMDAV